MINDSIRIMFLRDRQGLPVGCVAISVDRKNREVSYQYSVLNPIDSFDRRLARQLAIGRLIEKPITTPLYRGEVNMHIISDIVLSDLARSKTAPTRAVKAARLWLDTAI